MAFILSDKVRSRIRDIVPEAIDLRHRLHASPETKFEEKKTMALIRNYLAGGSVKLEKPMLGTDTIGLLEGSTCGPTVLLRADIDALPSRRLPAGPGARPSPGVAHACGHDGHTAMLLAAAKVLEACRDELTGNVRFVFQPAEEEIGGGKALVRAGASRTPSAARRRLCAPRVERTRCRSGERSGPDRGWPRPTLLWSKSRDGEATADSPTGPPTYRSGVPGHRRPPDPRLPLARPPSAGRSVGVLDPRREDQERHPRESRLRRDSALLRAQPQRLYPRQDGFDPERSLRGGRMFPYA